MPPGLESVHGVAKRVRHDLVTERQQQGGEVTIEHGVWWGKVWAGEVSLGALQRPAGYNWRRGDGEETLQNPHTGGGGGGGGWWRHSVQQMSRWAGEREGGRPFTTSSIAGEVKKDKDHGEGNTLCLVSRQSQ